MLLQTKEHQRFLAHHQKLGESHWTVCCLEPLKGNKALDALISDFQSPELKSECVSCSVVSDSLQAHGLWPPGSSVHGILQTKILNWRGQSFPSPGDLPHSGIKPRSPALQADSLPFEPPGNPVSRAMRIQISVTSATQFAYFVSTFLES